MNEVPSQPEPKARVNPFSCPLWKEFGLALIPAGVLGLAFIAVVLMQGCGGKGQKPNKLEGTVTLPDGSPLPWGKISVWRESRSHDADIKDGQFSLSGLPVGERYPVTVTTDHHLDKLKQIPEWDQRLHELQRTVEKHPETVDNQTRAQIEELTDQIRRMKDLRESYHKIPPRYTNSATTPIKVTIDKGLNELTIKIE